MPLLVESDIRYVDKPDTPSPEEHCMFCYEAGEHTIYRPMSEMVEIWVSNTEWYNQYTGTQNTPEEIREIMLQRLPTLSRWKQKLETENIHTEIVNKTIQYLQQHLFEPFDIEQLASMNNLSKFHFRRVFKTVTKESVASYIQRLRLEQIACLVSTTEFTLEEIVSQTNYQSKASLAKAFKKRFGITTTEYRQKYRQILKEDTNTELPYEIKWLPQQKILYVEIGDSYLNRDKYHAKWEQLQKQASQLGFDRQRCRFVSISLDDPSITPTEQCRFYIGMVVPSETKIHTQHPTMQLPEGKYVIFRHTGNFSSLRTVYQAVYEEWLPQNNYYPTNTLSFEVYDNQEESQQTGEWTTQIHIPIKKK